MSARKPLPILYVEGKDDISVVAALLFRHGIDTDRGRKHLEIKDLESVELLLESMPDAIKNATDRTVGFVVDIDIDLANRWDAIRGRLRELGLNVDRECPLDGFFGKLPDYPEQFGIWLMPDCMTDGQMLENLIQSLIPSADPLWPHAQACTAQAASIIDGENSKVGGNEQRWTRFSDTVLIKAEVRTWLAWQRVPGVQLGAAINDRILGHESPEASAFLNWLKALYGFEYS